MKDKERQHTRRRCRSCLADSVLQATFRWRRIATILASSSEVREVAGTKGTGAARRASSAPTCGALRDGMAVEDGTRLRFVEEREVR